MGAIAERKIEKWGEKMQITQREREKEKEREKKRVLHKERQ